MVVFRRLYFSLSMKETITAVTVLAMRVATKDIKIIIKIEREVVSLPAGTKEIITK